LERDKDEKNELERDKDENDGFKSLVYSYAGVPV